MVIKERGREVVGRYLLLCLTSQPSFMASSSRRYGTSAKKYACAYSRETVLEH